MTLANQLQHLVQLFPSAIVYADDIVIPVVMDSLGQLSDSPTYRQRT